MYLGSSGDKQALSAWNQTSYHRIANPFLSIGHSIFPIQLFGNIASCLGVFSGCFMPKKMRQKNTPSSFLTTVSLAFAFATIG